MSHTPAHIDFRANVQRVPPGMPASVRKATAKFLATREAVVGVLGDEQWQALRQAAHDLRLHTLSYLDYYLEMLEQTVTRAGGHVHWACDAQEAREIVLDIAQKHGVRRVVKVKSMVSEEIGLNHALEAEGIQARETDLGEYIIQLAGSGPSHIIVPAVHMTKEEIAALFSEKLGVQAPADPTALTELARGRLRQEFLSADMAISGANFLVAETGTLVMVTNEGNGRMCTTLPPLHVAVAGIDKVLPDWESLAVVLKLLARNATGQKLSTYTSFITGPRRSDCEGGPTEFHLVLLDNGRTRILQDPVARQTLLCIRCGACLNVCPVYNNVGGLAYGWVYPGPIGAILAPQLLGGEVAGGLPFASSLCGACADICPVKIPIPDILVHLRRRVMEGDAVEGPSASPVLAAGARVAALAFRLPWLYEWGSRLLKVFQSPLEQGGWLPHLPPPLDRWTMSRPFPAFSADFRDWWRKQDPRAGERAVRRQKVERLAGIAALGLAALAFGAWLWHRARGNDGRR